jgi:hypothetical protein
MALFGAGKIKRERSMSSNMTSEAFEIFGSFKPVAGGEVYVAPNRWLFGDRDQYLVNESQKADILSIVRSWRWPFVWITFLASMTIGILLGVGPKMWAERSGFPSIVSDLWSWTAAILSLYLALLISGQFLRHRLHRILATLRPAN